MSINKYKKKPIIIEAVQWTGINLEEIKSFVGDSLDYNYKTNWDSSDLSNIEVKIKTLEGDHIASIGDYIIKGVNGEFYPCKPDIFKKTYESAILAPPNEWVSVEEKLPDFDVPVLVYVKDVFDNKGTINVTKYTITYDLTNNWLGYENSSFKITHWMPLPAPPKRRSDNE